MLLEEQKTPTSTSVAVSRVFPHTPAEDGGVREGDRIIQVDSVSTSDGKIDKVSDALRGLAGTTVRVTFARPGVTVPVKLQFKRAVIHVPAVPFTTMLDGGVGYIPADVQREHGGRGREREKLVADGAHGIVLDLRDNGGGIVDQALAVSSLFLKPGQSIVNVRTRNAADEMARASDEQLNTQPPMVVLTDGGSASASEIVARRVAGSRPRAGRRHDGFGKAMPSIFRSRGVRAQDHDGQVVHAERTQHPPRADAAGRRTLRRDAPDSLETEAEKKAKPNFSDAGRVVYGGGGITPDLIVADDTLSTLEQDLLKSPRPRRRPGDGAQPVCVRAQVERAARFRRDAGVARRAASSVDGGWCVDRSEVRRSGVVVRRGWSAAWRACCSDAVQRRARCRRIISSRAVNLLKTARSQQDLFASAQSSSRTSATGSQGTPQR
jgi:carboxyl-terminal processing protease